MSAVLAREAEIVLENIAANPDPSSDEIREAYAKATALALASIARTLDDVAGPTCGHGYRTKFCPYVHVNVR